MYVCMYVCIIYASKTAVMVIDKGLVFLLHLIRQTSTRLQDNQPVSSLRGTVVITSRSLSTSVKIHWYTPASDRLKLEIRRSLRIRLPPVTMLSVMMILLPPTTCSPFLTHTTEGGGLVPEPTCPPVHLNTRLQTLALTSSTVAPRRTAVRLSFGVKLS